MVYEYLEDGMVVERKSVILGKEDEVVRTLKDYFSIIKSKRFNIPFFTGRFDYPEEKYKSELLKSKNLSIGDLETHYIKVVDMMMHKDLSPMKYEKFKKLIDLFFEEKGIDFVESEYNKLSDMGMSGENLALMFGEYKFF